MEQSQFSSMMAQLKLAYPYYFKDLKKEEVIALARLYKENLNFDFSVIESAIKRIIRTHKFMPSIGEIVEECENSSRNRKFDVIERMKADGYFKSSYELEKTYHFLEDGTIPKWLLEDMKRYGYQEQNSLTNTETKRIGVGENAII